MSSFETPFQVSYEQTKYILCTYIWFNDYKWRLFTLLSILTVVTSFVRTEAQNITGRYIGKFRGTFWGEVPSLLINNTLLGYLVQLGMRIGMLQYKQVSVFISFKESLYIYI